VNIIFKRYVLRSKTLLFFLLYHYLKFQALQVIMKAVLPRR
jgi:hypothetical protein